MDNGIKQISKAQQAALTAAKEEKSITSAQISSEILPLLDDYFMGRFEQTDGGLKAEFLNGQTFYINITEC